MKDDRLYLGYISEAINRIEQYTAKGHDEFLDSIIIQDAVIRNFEIIGEAAKQISKQTFEKTPSVPWRQITGFRDVLIHGYMGIDPEEVWNVISDHLPNLKKAVTNLLA